VVVNVPSLAVEEVTPSFQSDANLLAPEEIQAKSKPQDVGNLCNVTESTLLLLCTLDINITYDKSFKG